MPRQMLYKHYSNHVKFRKNIDKIFKDKSSQGCALKGDLQDQVILDGDKIKDCMVEKEGIKFVDFILINKNFEGKINILLCELDRGKSGKSVTEVKKKMQILVNIFLMYSKKVSLIL